MKDTPRYLDDSRLSNIDGRYWEKNAAIHLPATGASRLWICRDAPFPLLIVLPDSRQARDFAADSEALRKCVSLPEVITLPEIPIASFTDDNLFSAQKAARGEAMTRWQDTGGILVSTPGAMMAPISVGGDALVLVRGSEMRRGLLIEWLEGKGYDRVDIVWAPGQYTYRGGIVDFFDPKDAYPIRVEFFDEEIESMRFFETDTQRSVRSFSRGEARALRARLDDLPERFIPQAARVVFFEPGDIENAADNYAWLRDGVERGSDHADTPILWLDVEKNLARYPRVRVTRGVARSEARTKLTGLPNFRGRRGDLEAFCRDLVARGINVSIVSESVHFREWGERQGFAASEGAISEGFVDTGAGIAFIGDLELSGFSIPSRSRGGVPLDWRDRLMPDQWVVHEDYGVARYMGSEQIENGDGVQEYLVLEYAEERRLKIPVTHFHKIAPYVSYPGAEPVADNLRGGHWKKLSARAREQALAAASHLIEVYAKRELSPGHAFAGDPEQELEFERAFPFRETEDQLRAIEETKNDMARSVPMDRLLVGDVGFGKTEVALRASARAVFDGKQVAVMAPTTLLAQQHYETFSSRFDSFGVRVEVISRFIPASRQQKIIEDAAQGAVDILIGTHRLLGPDVRFKDLGLAIVDEEHRFGVLHKEHLKDLYPTIDVLMLSATPIPRSLHLSLSGLRDMSLLQTPPNRRLPVITAVGPWSETLVKSAVVKEKARGGQVFYVHNRVRTIEREALTIRRLFPKLKIGVAHGQMPEKRLAAVMEQFSSGELDILVCTTIVESGLDIPRANTLIVTDAHELGLAQMHQLRGRVGRRDEQAFALFLHPLDVTLTREAVERMEAIAAMGEFGAGYQLSKKDLEIRGGGELVGISQHGNLGRVGFQRYCDLLEEAIARAKGDYRERTHIEVGIPSAIPKDYLPHDSLRVALYRKLLWVREAPALQDLYNETIDRFGPMPRPLKFLFDVARIRVIGPDYRISKVLCGRDETIIQGDPEGAMGTMKAPWGWSKRLDGFIGPGGFSALGDFIGALTKE